MQRLVPRRTTRVVLLSACALVVAVLFGSVVRQSWVTNSLAAQVVAAEARGASMLHPMSTLLEQLVTAQSAAVRGEPVNAEGVRTALAEVAEHDRVDGAQLQTRQRLADLTNQIESAFARNEKGRAAYDTYTSLVTLTVDLIHRIGDTSQLIHDPDLDTYYLMDAAIVRLPTAVVLAGRAADLIALAGGEALTGEDAVRAAVARFGVSAAAEELNAGLTKSVDFTSRTALGERITQRLDAFKSAADAFAPPTMVGDLSTTVDAAVLAANARRVSAAANPLAHRLLGELEELLRVRAGVLNGQWRFTAWCTAIVVVVGLFALWVVIVGRTTPDPVRPRHRASADDLPVGSLTFARDLLDGDELVPIGRAARRGDRDAR